ncbi:hypothetical protein MHU86_4535 [Fragilaria crotonensis]|nr:hypothetical protein MHU86_4535 [Fragilaria crotonensis]
MGKGNGWRKGLVVLVFVARPVVAIGRDSFVRITRPDSGSESSFYELAGIFEVENNCENGSVEKIILGKQGKCDRFVSINAFVEEAGGDIEMASLLLFESTLSVDSSKGDALLFMNITDGSDNYSISNSTNPLHMVDKFNCTVQVISFIQSRDLGDTENDGNTDERKLSDADMNLFEHDPRDLLDNANASALDLMWAQAVETDVSSFVGERSDPACVRRRVTQVVNLQATFKRRASLPAGHLLREELALSIMGISIGTILTISIVSVVAFKELQERGFFSKKKGSKSKANIRASSKKQQAAPESSDDSDSD